MRRKRRPGRLSSIFPVFPSSQTPALSPRVCLCSQRTNYYSKSSTESLYQLGGGEYIITYITAEAGLAVGVRREREEEMDGWTAH